MLRRVIAVGVLCGLWAGCGGGGGSASRAPDISGRLSKAAAMTNPELRSRELQSIAQVQVDSNDEYGAKTTLTEATTAAEQIAEPLSKLRGLTATSRLLVRIQDKPAARKNIAAAKQAWSTLTDAEQQANGLLSIGLAQAAVGDGGDCLASAKQAEELIAKLDGAADLTVAANKNRLLINLSTLYLKVEAKEDAQRALTTATEMAEGATDARTKAKMLAAIGGSLHKQGQEEPAGKRFQEALAAAQSVDDDYRKGHALLDVAEELNSAGRYGEAQDVYKQVGDVTPLIKVQDQRRDVDDRMVRMIQGK